MVWLANMPSCHRGITVFVHGFVLCFMLKVAISETLPNDNFQASLENSSELHSVLHTSTNPTDVTAKLQSRTETTGVVDFTFDSTESFTKSVTNIEVTSGGIALESTTSETFVTVTDNYPWTFSPERQNTIDTKRTPIYIGGLFELSGSRGAPMGLSELTAARMAVDHVNREDLLEGFELRLLHNNSKCDPGVGMDALYDLIYRREQILMMMGSACSEVTKTLAEIVPYWNLILVSFASTSPALSKREKYKTFFRLAPADSSQNAPRTMFIQHFGWDAVATLYESNEVFSLAINEMGNTFEQNNITIVASMSFRQVDDIAIKLKALKEKDARIIIGGFSENAARQVLCEAYRLNMYGPRYVWIMTGDYVSRWWELSNNTNCTVQQLGEAADGYFTIDSLNSLSDEDMSTANISLRDFLSDYQQYNGTKPMSPYATSTYDTVWTIALTLRKSIEYWRTLPNKSDELRLDSFSYDGGKAMSEIFFNIMQNLGFLGISGPISFEGPDRKGISVIHQNQAGTMKRIALYEPKDEKLDFYCRTCEPIIWLGGRAPRDKYVMVPRQKKVMPLAFYCISSVSIVGLLLAVCFLAYNLYHRRLRYIKLSSPKLNNVAVVGCMLVYAGIIIRGFDDSSLDEKYYPSVCTVRAFLFAAGFSLAFGAMFTKTYRVHQIFTRANRGLIKSKLLRDKQLLFIIGALLVVDSAVVIVWRVVDPMYKQITNLTVEASENDEDLLFIYQLTKCHSSHLEKWTGGLYAYKGLLLIFGLYMAWETRSVKIPALNDSQYIGMNVYNVVIMSAIVVVLSNILSHQPTLAYIMESSFMLLSTTMTLCLLFVPKIYAIATSGGSPVIAASGIAVDSNCRRFIVDEKRELFYRAEVQNRVYKREIVELDQEISRLERLLELPMQPYRKLTKELLCLLPESRVDPAPATRRRLLHERERCNSISDAGDVCLGMSEDKSEDDPHGSLRLKPPSPQPLRRRSTRLSIRVATNYAVSKLCKFRPRFSIGSVNFKPDYEDLKGSPSSPEGQSAVESFLARNRISHPLLRQQAVEEKRELDLLSTIKQSSERSDTHTVESQLSVNDTLDSDTAAQNCPVVTFSVDDPTPSDSTGCEMTLPCSGSIPDSDKDATILTVPSAPKVRRKYGNTLDIPSQVCRITSVDMHAADETPRMRRARSIIESERRTRIRKLQTDLRNIQKELQDLDELEYEVSHV